MRKAIPILSLKFSFRWILRTASFKTPTSKASLDNKQNVVYQDALAVVAFCNWCFHCFHLIAFYKVLFNGTFQTMQNDCKSKYANTKRNSQKRENLPYCCSFCHLKLFIPYPSFGSKIFQWRVRWIERMSKVLDMTINQVTLPDRAHP